MHDLKGITFCAAVHRDKSQPLQRRYILLQDLNRFIVFAFESGSLAI